MENYSCKTYFAVCFGFDVDRNAALLRERRSCSPEEIGILNKDEVEKFIVEQLGVTPDWRRHHFVIGYNDKYDVDVNAMIRITLKGLSDKAEKIREMQKKFSVSTVLEIVPYIAGGSEEPSQYLSLERDIIEFLFNSGTAMDLDYYVI